MSNRLLLVAPLLAAPLFSQSLPEAADPIAKGSSVDWFLLNESASQVRKALGQPSLLADFGADFQSWQFQIGDIDHHDFSHLAVFRKSTNELISVTRNYEPEVLVDHLFPSSETTVHHYPNARKPEMSLRARLLPGDRVLIAIGSSQPGQTTNQLMLIHKTELRHFYRWLADQLDEAQAQSQRR